MADSRLDIELRARDQASRVFGVVGNNAERMARTIRNAVLGVVSFAAFKSLVSTFKETADNIDLISKTSRRLNIATEFLAGLAYQGKLAGVTLQDLTTGIRTLVKNFDDFREGKGEAADIFKALGIDPNQNPEQVFRQVVDGLSKVRDGVRQTAAAQLLFGRSGTQLLSIVQDGVEGIERYQVEAQKLGLIFTRDAAVGVENLNDEITRLSEAFDGLKTSLITEIAPAITPIIEDINRLTQSMALLRAVAKGDFKAAAASIIDIFVVPSIDGLVKLQAEIDKTRAKAAGLRSDEGGKPPASPPETVSAGRPDSIERVFLPANTYLNGVRAAIRDTRIELANVFGAGREQAKQFIEGLGQDWSTLFFDIFERRLTDLGEFFRRFFQNILTNINRLLAQQTSDSLLSLLFRQLGGIFPGGVTATTTTSGTGEAIGTTITGSARGNILRGGFRAFAGGGVVRRPTLGLIGEGGQNEAVVPLPDGRRIPVEMRGGGSGGVVIQINAVDAQSFVALASKDPDALANLVIGAVSRKPALRNALNGGLR